MPSVPKAEVALAVQGLIGEIPRVGFALSGHVTLLLGKAQGEFINQQMYTAMKVRLPAHRPRLAVRLQVGQPNLHLRQ